MTAATFYIGKHDCGVCVAADRAVVRHLSPTAYRVETVDLTARPDRRAEAAAAGVRTVPALVVGGQVFHINFGANLGDL